MANIIDYVNWRGDISFDERPLNEIDVMVLCHLGYADMTPAFTGIGSKRERTIKEVWDELGENVKFRLITSGRNDRKLLEQCAKSKRFGSVVISNYVDETSVIANMQFAALTYHVSDKEVVVVFRGTDDTIVGWKEDFMISYTKVPAQEKAYSYLKRTLARNEKCHVAGHSKGANLALFAVAHLEKEELDKVAKVYLNDGPGFCNEVLDTELVSKIDHKCVRITPEFCIVGGIFEPKITENYIVKSSGTQMMQHSLLTWQVSGDGLVTTTEHDSASEQINTLFDKFIEKMDDLKDRQAFVNSIFDTMGENGAVTVEEFTKEGPKAFENLIFTVLGDNAEGLNPLKSVKDNVVSDIKNSSIGKAMEEKKDKKKIFRIAFCVAFAILCFLIPDAFIKTAFAVTIFAIVAYQVYLTIHHLRKSNWDISKERIRVNVSIVLIVAYVVLIVKDDALFLFASILFGVIFLVSAYQCFINIKASWDDKLRVVRYSFQGILLTLYGGYLMVGPEVGLEWYTISCGIFVLLDAVFELIHLLRVRSRFKN
ncbi:Mbeg1-like protein [Butyrivibrio hungatei]|uniref:DUF2974 domain-containing protein n=1 Tax=Butyrivibrio hungatei TaxID=185008 RepID=A0A1D9P3I9_9FIRM|nr:Mbeg1-like protein [Butyrivibrio hungatei]AOZ97158.1 hypothetical protein bhn_I2125 [Butyrivibrio hungatei]